MTGRNFYGALSILFLAMVACSFKQRVGPVDHELLYGKYCHSHDRRDSIFVYPDKTYKHTYHRTDGLVNTQKNKWVYKPDINNVFFESFLFYNDGEHAESDDYDGSWPTTVFVGENGEIKLQYSESVHYIKDQTK